MKLKAPPRVQDLDLKPAVAVPVPAPAKPRRRGKKPERVEQECDECGVLFTGPIRDGLCGSNCRAIREEIEVEEAEGAEAPVPEDIDIPMLEEISVEWCEHDRATKDIDGKGYGRNVWQLNVDLGRLRSQSSYIVKVQVKAVLVGGETFVMRPDQYAMKAYEMGEYGPQTIQAHVQSYRSRLLELADRGEQVQGHSPEQLAQSAVAFERLLLALGE